MRQIISRCLLVVAMTLCVLAAAGPAGAAPLPALTGALSVKAAAGTTTQMLTVSAPSATSTTATLTAWELQANGTWTAVIGPIPANVGGAGVGAASEGSSKTPAGTWGLTQAFGRQANPGTALPYFKTDVQDWWSSNTASPNYNTHVRQVADPGGNSENLYRIGAVYDYAVVMDYNLARVPGAGSAFFLHVSDGSPTGGCVSIDRSSLIRIMQWLDPSRSPVISIGVNLPPPAAQPLTDGSFVLNAGTIYRIAGGAPIPVTNWGAVGGFQTYRTLSDTEFATLPLRPREGTFVNGSSGTIYRIAGGAPLPVTDWSTVGGYQAFTTIDEAAITNAGAPGVWNHLRATPADGTFILGSSGTVYRVAGGAPLPVSDWASVGGGQPFIRVDEAAVTNAGAGGPWSHLNAVPADGTFLRGSSGTVYRVAGGAPLAVSDWAKVGGYQAFTSVDEAAITNAGAGGLWNHLSFYPADGTFVRPADSPGVYRIAGGVATAVMGWEQFGGPQPTTLIDGTAITNAGAGGPWDHLKKPA